jgi:hypothetical protein
MCSSSSSFLFFSFLSFYSTLFPCINQMQLDGQVSSKEDSFDEPQAESSVISIERSVLFCLLPLFEHYSVSSLVSFSLR